MHHSPCITTRSRFLEFLETFLDEFRVVVAGCGIGLPVVVALEQVEFARCLFPLFLGVCLGGLSVVCLPSFLEALVCLTVVMRKMAICRLSSSTRRSWRCCGVVPSLQDSQASLTWSKVVPRRPRGEFV